MEQRTVLWMVGLIAIAALMMGFTRPTPTYTGVPLGGDSKGIIVLNTVTGEAVKYCALGGCIEMPHEVRPHPRNSAK